MREYVARLIDCGFSRSMAVWLCKHYYRREGMRGLERYVMAVEEENREPLEVV